MSARIYVVRPSVDRCYVSLSVRICMSIDSVGIYDTILGLYKKCTTFVKKTNNALWASSGGEV